MVGPCSATSCCASSCRRSRGVLSLMPIAFPRDFRLSGNATSRARNFISRGGLVGAPGEIRQRTARGSERQKIFLAILRRENAVRSKTRQSLFSEIDQKK